LVEYVPKATFERLYKRSKRQTEYHIEGYFPEREIFPNGIPLALEEIFPSQKFPSITANNISHEYLFASVNAE